MDDFEIPELPEAPEIPEISEVPEIPEGLDIPETSAITAAMADPAEMPEPIIDETPEVPETPPGRDDSESPLVFEPPEIHEPSHSTDLDTLATNDINRVIEDRTQYIEDLRAYEANMTGSGNLAEATQAQEEIDMMDGLLLQSIQEKWGVNGDPAEIVMGPDLPESPNNASAPSGDDVTFHSRSGGIEVPPDTEVEPIHKPSTRDVPYPPGWKPGSKEGAE